MDKIKELITELRQEIQSCQMDIAGGNKMNVLDALNSVTEIEQLIILRVRQQRELLLAFMQMREGHAVNTKDIKLIDEFLKT